MTLIQLDRVDYSVGGPLLLDKASFNITTGERIAIVGRNGAGKSTLLQLLAGARQADDGTIRRQDGIRIAAMAQEVPQDTDGSVFAVVTAGLGEAGTLLRRYHAALDAGDLDGMAQVQAQIEAEQAWNVDQQVAQTIERLGLDGQRAFASLSGGMKRRVLLAQALVSSPDVLLLDEPTNHLDVDAIQWLEGFLHTFAGSIVFVTHDRQFLRNLATRIVEIDRGQLTDWPGDYANYLRRQAERSHAESLANAAFDKKLKQEEAWIRQGIKARRTRNEGRVRALKKMRMERAQRREKAGSSQMQLESGKASGKKVAVLDRIHYTFPDRVLIDHFSTTIMRGDRIGIVGPNGSGKSTLIKIMLGQMQPHGGSVELGTGLDIAYFDQHRLTLNSTLNALDNVADGREFIELSGKKTHIMGYMQNFLFTPERALSPITRLSGGERNRLLLAKLFSYPSNVLIMDEPTNDLDIETLELLEDVLAQYKGTLLLVSHDRTFLDNVITSTLVMEGNGVIGEYVGGYSDIPVKQPPAVQKKTEAKPSSKPAPKKKPPAKLTYNDQRELAQLPEKIETLENALGELSARMADPDFYQQDSATISQTGQDVQQLQTELDAAYARWEELESRA